MKANLLESGFKLLKKLNYDKTMSLGECYLELIKLKWSQEDIVLFLDFYEHSIYGGNLNIFKVDEIEQKRKKTKIEDRQKRHDLHMLEREKDIQIVNTQREFAKMNLEITNKQIKHKLFPQELDEKELENMTKTVTKELHNLDNKKTKS